MYLNSKTAFDNDISKKFITTPKLTVIISRCMNYLSNLHIHTFALCVKLVHLSLIYGRSMKHNKCNDAQEKEKEEQIKGISRVIYSYKSKFWFNVKKKNESFKIIFEQQL